MKELFTLPSDYFNRSTCVLSWQSSGNVLAAGAQNGLVRIVDRQGQVLEELMPETSDPIDSLSWDAEGIYLAFIQQGSSIVYLWNNQTRTMTQLDTEMKQPSFLVWSTYAPLLAVGGSKGNVLIYNRNTRRKIPVMGKHSKKIVCGCWNKRNQLALGSADNTVTISNTDGDTLDTIYVKSIPKEVNFASQQIEQRGRNSSGIDDDDNSSRRTTPHSISGKSDNRAYKDSTLSINCGGKSLVLYTKGEEEIILAFQSKYGNIVGHSWYGDGYMIIGFSEGYLVTISTLPEERGEEKMCMFVPNFPFSLISFNREHQKVAVLGDTIKIFDVLEGKEIRDEEIEIDLLEIGRPSSLLWSPEGQMLTYSTKLGVVKTHLVHVLPLYAVYGSKVATLSSLKEVSISFPVGGSPSSAISSSFVSPSANQNKVTKVEVAIEPSLLALSCDIVAVGMNATAYYYRIQDGTLVNEIDYMNTIKQIVCNSQYTAVLCKNGKVTLHSIENQSTTTTTRNEDGLESPSKSGPVSQSKKQIFPLPDFDNDDDDNDNMDAEMKNENSGRGGGRGRGFASSSSNINISRGKIEIVTSIFMNENYFYYSTNKGKLEMFHLKDWTLLSSIAYKHDVPIVSIFPNASGTRIAFIDSHSLAHLYNPISSELVAFPDFPTGKPATYGCLNGLLALWDLEASFSNPNFGSTSSSRKLNIFHAFDPALNQLHSYTYYSTSINGSAIAKMGQVNVSEAGEVTMEPVVSQLTRGMFPILCVRGSLVCYTNHSDIKTLELPCTKYTDLDTRDKSSHNMEMFQIGFCNNLAMGNLAQAWIQAFVLKSRANWLALAGKAMELMEIEIAQLIHRTLGDAGMVSALETMKKIEDKNLLSGQIHLLFGDHARAQELFLSSSNPLAALAMHRDLLNWDQALKLATTLCPDLEGEISVSYAQSLEFKGDFENAFRMYENALKALEIHPANPALLNSNDSHNSLHEQEEQQISSLTRDFDQAMSSLLVGPSGSTGDGSSYSNTNNNNNNNSDKKAIMIMTEENRAIESLLLLAKGGYARCTLRLGNIRRGMTLVLEGKDQNLFRECASILESNKATWAEAGLLYEKAGMYEKAAHVYIQLKAFSSAAKIIQYVTLPKLHQQYAKICESEKKYVEAMEAYKKAHDIDNVVRLLLDELKSPEKAFSIVREERTPTSAAAVAKYCAVIGDFRGGIEFLLMSGNSNEAFEIAKQNNIVEIYTDSLGEEISVDEARAVAHYYETKQELGLAGHFYSLCGQYTRALKFFLQYGEREIDGAIAVVGTARDDMLTHMLIDFLMGETDGVPKDPNYIYRLYMALGNFVQASKTAVIIARQEQNLGHYDVAHSILQDSIQQLESRRVKVPQTLRQSFVLLHSYTLVKRFIKRDDHQMAARLLLRVAKNISRFPSHTVRFLTSTVIECQRSGLKEEAYEYATTLVMNADYRSQIDPKLKRKIEQMVRRKPKNGESNVNPTDSSSGPTTADTTTGRGRDGGGSNNRLSPCPISGLPLDIMELEAPTTKDAIPMCIITGRHLEVHDWCICPNSNMHALYSEYVKYIEYEENQSVTTTATSEREEGERKHLAYDPVCNKPIKVTDLIIVSPEDVPRHIAFYNHITSTVEEEEEAEGDGEEINGNKNKNRNKDNKIDPSSTDGKIGAGSGAKKKSMFSPGKTSQKKTTLGMALSGKAEKLDASFGKATNPLKQMGDGIRGLPAN